MVAEASLLAEDSVWFEGMSIGQVLSAGFSPVAEQHVAVAVLDNPYCHAGIDRFTAGTDGVAVTTVSPPVLVNRSLYINPQRHAYATRERDKFPALV
jgi:glycine cleavage system aminomethyltransferase T